MQQRHVEPGQRRPLCHAGLRPVHPLAQRLRGCAVAQSPEVLREQLPDMLEDASNELPWLARVALQRA